MDDSLHPLHALNIRIAELEGARNSAELAPLLHDALVFRRASGAVVGKTDYLAGLDAIVSVRWCQTVVLRVDAHGEDLATVSCLVAVDRAQVNPDGTQKTVQGLFLNVRTWTRVDGAWKMLGWFNSRA